ncbi:hypothetical protein F4778DRAFT_633809 [Xylariomycetidae sp. FL2044]|nr:hypothetical protein F4778DRAFT_633809 [Xylariomycetidae sp. FL2044]
MYSPMPTYSSQNRAVGTALNGDLPTSQISRPRTASSSSSAFGHTSKQSLTHLLQPALDGPPSPEHLRAFTQQVRVRGNSASDRHRHELTTPSTSSLGSASSDRPSRNPSLESLHLSRNSSQRSVSNGIPSRDRPDSVQILGKAFFHRRGKLRREGSDSSSPNASLHSVETPADAAAMPQKDPRFVQAMFARRRLTRGDSETLPQRKLQISGPYNFQHLTHTQKEDVPNLNRTNGMELGSDFSRTRPRRMTDASTISIQFNESHIPHSSTAGLAPHQRDPSAGSHTRGHTQKSPRRTPSDEKVLPPTPLVTSPTRHRNRADSQDKRVPPPRPPRSPLVDTPYTSPIPPPPRTSSRVSMRYDGLDPLSTTTLERPVTSSGIRQPQPFFIPPSLEGMRPPATSHGLSPQNDQTSEDCTEEVSHAITTPDEAAWPLSNNVVQSLPDVPEEEESHALSRQSRMSVASNRSSLRASVSVPLLRQMSLTRGGQRPTSNASETLGRFDLFAAQRALRCATTDDIEADDFSPVNWEEDIDYCYEHAAEADCDYAWERPSIDLVRAQEEEDQGSDAGSMQSHRMLCPAFADVPALSPASQTSLGTQQEAVTPNLSVTAASNFSLPRRDSSAMLLRDHDKSWSRPSSFKESQGFTLSPSLLIPNDYHQEMLRYEREELHDRDCEDDCRDEGMGFGKALTVSQARSSGSTTHSTLSDHSLISSRHKSTTSTSTAFTRWTGSSTASWQAHSGDCPNAPKPAEADFSVSQPFSIKGGGMAELPEMGEPPAAKPDAGHSRAQSDANLLLGGGGQDTLGPLGGKLAKDSITKRRRARTTSRSHNTPPQFALFPSVAHNNPAGGGGRF